jgi:hypothetical protein
VKIVQITHSYYKHIRAFLQANEILSKNKTTNYVLKNKFSLLKMKYMISYSHNAFIYNSNLICNFTSQHEMRPLTHIISLEIALNIHEFEIITKTA